MDSAILCPVKRNIKPGQHAPFTYGVVPRLRNAGVQHQWYQASKITQVKT